MRQPITRRVVYLKGLRMGHASPLQALCALLEGHALRPWRRGPAWASVCCGLLKLVAPPFLLRAAPDPRAITLSLFLIKRGEARRRAATAVALPSPNLRSAASPRPAAWHEACPHFTRSLHRLTAVRQPSTGRWLGSQGSRMARPLRPHASTLSHVGLFT